MFIGFVYVVEYWFLFFFQVKQCEEEIQCSKMILWFCEDKIKRMEIFSDGGVIMDIYFVEERNVVLKEL